MKLLSTIFMGFVVCMLTSSLSNVYAKAKEHPAQVDTQKRQKNRLPCTKETRTNCRKSGHGKQGASARFEKNTTQGSALQDKSPGLPKDLSTDEEPPGIRVRSNPPGLILDSKFSIYAKGFDFGGDGFAFGRPTTGGKLFWILENGELTAYLSGAIHLNNVNGECGRMLMDFYDLNGVYMNNSVIGGEFCANDNKHHHWNIDLNNRNNANSFRSHRLNEVRVVLQKLGADGVWLNVNKQILTLPNEHDSITVTEDGFDFGGDAFFAGVPTTGGVVEWAWSGTVTPHVTGKLWINNAAGACARMKIEYFNLHDHLLTTKYGGKVCAPDNARDSWTVDLQPYESREIASISVGLQTLGADNQWQNLGSTKSEYMIEWVW